MKNEVAVLIEPCYSLLRKTGVEKEIRNAFRAGV